MNDFKILDHPADIGIEVYGKTLEELFCNALRGVSFLTIEPISLKENITKEINVRGKNIEDLFINFLDEIIYLFDAEGLLIKHAIVQTLHATSVRATLHGEKFNKTKHKIKLYLKAVTYHQLEIKEEKDNWKARVFFDV